ncbi:glycosyl transferase family 2 (plasmid) [Neorhizobium sp. SOG26]|uniref:glycosyltransferase family 2 protein n=1 Tax=Neorhizobium sp. SOG26 TaxID=2060726 RepID=UPI000E5728F9|nr:glycosyltransferase family 2 protein [Neorhizobium sp. SOG26]AXV17689.1 glycosyl transferase family 2 [Neorhizobium sp. SOG26]
MTNQRNDGTNNRWRLAIIIVNYRTADLTVDCLASLAAPATVPDGTCVIVVDGGSGDGSAQRIASAIDENGWSNMACLALQENGGFAYGNNRGIEYAAERFGDPDYVLLLNPDTVARPMSIIMLVGFMDNEPRAGIAGSSLEHPDGRKQACAFRFPSISNEFEGEAKLGPITRLLDRWRVVPEMPQKPSRIDWVSGACMIMRSDLLHDVGLLDDRFFLYFEETDFCLRAARAGWSCWHVPQSRVVHLVGQATGVTRYTRPARRPPYWFQSRNLYFLKNHGLLYASLANLAWLCGHLVFRLRVVIERRQSGLPPHLLLDFLRHVGLGSRRGLSP